jgi:hypothetical protein
MGRREILFNDRKNAESVVAAEGENRTNYNLRERNKDRGDLPGE